MDGKKLIKNINESILSESHKVTISGIKFDVRLSKNIEADMMEDLDKYVHYENKVFNDDIYYITSILDDKVYERALSSISEWNFEEEIVIYSSRQLGDTLVKKYVTNDNLEVFYCQMLNFIVLADGVKKYLIMCDKTEEYERQTLRIMKEVIIRFYENDGGIIFHSAAFNVDNNGCILTGLKGAGKTTFLCRMLDADNTEYISNDKIIITKDLDVIYLPLSMRIGLGTYDNFDNLKKYVENVKLDRVQYYNDKKIDWSKVEEKYVKYDLTSKELKKIFNFRSVSSTKLKYLLIPKIDIDGRDFRVMKMSDEEKKNVILENCITLDNSMWPNPWVEKRTCSEEEIRKNSHELLKKIDNVQYYYVEYGSKVPSKELCEKLREKLSE